MLLLPQPLAPSPVLLLCCARLVCTTEPPRARAPPAREAPVAASRWQRLRGAGRGACQVAAMPGAPGELGFIRVLVNNLIHCCQLHSTSLVLSKGRGQGRSAHGLKCGAEQIWASVVSQARCALLVLSETPWEILILSRADGTKEASSPRLLFPRFGRSIMIWLHLL